MNVYQMEGSEDGTLCIYGSATRAVAHAMEYTYQAKIRLIDNLATLRKDGFVILYDASDVTNATVTQWNVV